ncbi:uncharacterized protein LOC142979550 [Anticarsia gemmatalis]|uniref:uncharacterized protein LOC142979550 n=1 Tax=Anticarsia gemmatalis TaxID=129554 RepID=UPI003F773FAE
MKLCLFMLSFSCFYAGYNCYSGAEQFGKDRNPYSCRLKRRLNPFNPLRELTESLPNHNIEVQIEFQNQQPPPPRIIHVLKRLPRRKDRIRTQRRVTPSSTSTATTKFEPLKRPVNVEDLNNALNDLEKRLEKKLQPQRSGTCTDQKETANQNDNEDVVQILLKRGTPPTTIPEFLDVYITLPEENSVQVPDTNHQLQSQTETFDLNNINEAIHREFTTRRELISEPIIKDRIDYNHEDHESFVTHFSHATNHHLQIFESTTSSADSDFLEMQFSKRTTPQFDHVSQYRNDHLRQVFQRGKGAGMIQANDEPENGFDTDQDHVFRNQDYINGMISAEQRARLRGDDIVTYKGIERQYA